MRPETTTLRDQEFTLARHLRDPANHAPPPALEDRRLRVYRELFFGAMEGLLAGGFPVIRETLGEKQWTALVHQFYANHHSRTPLFPELAGEFVAYLDGRANDADLPPWLPDLAHYEWIEQALFLSDAHVHAHDPDGDLLNGVPLLSPLAQPLAYRWPVTAIGPRSVPETAPKEPTLLLVHRDATHQVRFTRIAPPAYRLLASLQAHAWSGRQHLAALATEIGLDANALEADGMQMLRQLRADGVLLGTQRDDVQCGG